MYEILLTRVRAGWIADASCEDEIAAVNGAPGR